MRPKYSMMFLLQYLPLLGLVFSEAVPFQLHHAHDPISHMIEGSSQNSINPPIPHHSLTSNLDADEICHTPDFQSTIENWWLSGATEWLKDYTLTNNKTQHYQELGLIGSLASTYLKRTNFKCSIDTAHRCVVECQEVVRKVPDLGDARVVYFTLRSAQNIAEVTKLVHDTLVTAQLNMVELVPIMSKTFFWTEGFDDHMWAVIFTHTIRTLSSLFSMFYPMMLGVLDINKNLQRIAEQITTSVSESYDIIIAKQNEVRITNGEDPALNKELEMLEENHKRLGQKSKFITNTIKLAKLGVTDLILGQIGSGIMQAFGTANMHINHHGKHPGTERTQESNELNLVAFIRSTCMRARHSLKIGTEVLFNGSILKPDGTSIFSEFTTGGNFLPDSTDDATKWRDSGIEKKITRGLMLKTLNVALNSQPIYITCSKDYRHTSKPWEPSVETKALAPSCKKDTSGPKDFKACIDGWCCYLYKWNNRGWAPSWRNEKIFGSDVLDEDPWNVEVADIITSSVRSYFENLRAPSPATGLTRGIFSAFADGQPVESLWDAATPGMFTVPVCFSKYNWATIIDGYRFPQNGIFDSQPRNSIKNLPCSCGPWGRDTEAVWREVGIWKTDGKGRGYFKDYTVGKCGYQIYDKIQDPVERFVAYCHVDVHATMNYRIRKSGKHWQCRIITDLIKKLGYPSIHEMDPSVYHAIWCKVAFMASTQSKCKGYYEQPLRVVLNNMGTCPSMIEADEKMNEDEEIEDNE